MDGGAKTPTTFPSSSHPACHVHTHNLLTRACSFVRVPSCHPCILRSPLSLSTSICPSASPFLFFLLLLFEQHTELDNLIAMQNLRNSANKGSNDAYDVHTSLTKGRSPTLRHVSRTDRVGLDLLFDWIILESVIQVKIVDAQNQLADILTKGSFTRDRWDRLHRLFVMVGPSVFSHSHLRNFLVRIDEVMSTRHMHGNDEELSRGVATSRPERSLIADIAITPRK